MRSTKFSLLCTTVIPAFVGLGITVGGAVSTAATARAAGFGAENSSLLPIAKPKPQSIQLAQCKPCNPCAAKKACNPCGAKKASNPCNPCAAKNPCSAKGACNPCNPCAAGGAAVSKKCVVPRLQAAWAKHPCNPCNPCRPKKKACNPCNPCAAKNPCGAKKACNPCAAKNPCGAKKACNPCAAKNPCGAKKACNPCNPCGGATVAEISAAEAKAVYDCLLPEMKKAYRKAGLRQVKDYTVWLKVNTHAYQSATHGNRYVNNYADSHGDYRYKMFEKAGKMPLGSVLAKDSFVVRPDGKVAVGPLFIMEKMKAGFNKESGDWRYTMIMPDGKVAGTTKGKGMSMKFCAECHAGVAPEKDHIMLVPPEYRVKF